MFLAKLSKSITNTLVNNMFANFIVKSSITYVPKLGFLKIRIENWPRSENLRCTIFRQTFVGRDLMLIFPRLPSTQSKVFSSLPHRATDWGSADCVKTADLRRVLNQGDQIGRIFDLSGLGLVVEPVHRLLDERHHPQRVHLQLLAVPEKKTTETSRKNP
jgi:hypothetical protein